MTDSQGGEAAVVETNAGADGAPVSSERDFESEAREQGWRPKEEWTGKSENWKDAKTWVEHGDLRTSIESKLRAEYDGRFSKLEKMSQKAQDAIKNGYEQQIADLKAERREAIKKGDDKLVDKYDDAIEKVKEAAKDDGSTPTDTDVEADFKKRNEWYETDEELAALAERYSRQVEAAWRADDKNKGVKMPYDQNLREVEKKVKASALYQSKYGKKPAANGHAAVDGGSDSPAAAPKTDTLFAKLPPEAKKQCAEDVKAGIYKTNEDWAKVYFS